MIFLGEISISDFDTLLRDPEKISLDDKTYQRITKSHNYLNSKIGKGIIYGLNSGFGALGNRKIPKQNQDELQIKLIYHLATGVGECFTEKEASAILLARLISLSKGYSGISPFSFEQLLLFFQKKIIPMIPSLGTVGASGDLTPLAHLVLSFLGEGSLSFQGRVYDRKEFFHIHKHETLQLKGRDALAIVNGTSASTAIACLSMTGLEKALRVSLFHSFLFSEVFELSGEFFHPLFYKVKPHLGMKIASSKIIELCEKSPRIKKINIYNSIEPNDQIQPPYTLRAVIQLLGSIIDFALDYQEKIECELNSVSDNPIFFSEEDIVLHGANFYGSHIAFASDGIKNLTTSLANFTERRIARITDEKLNSNLPAFLSCGEIGLDSGLMGAQVTASALLAEIRSLGIPASTLSIPTNANNQDIVPMACTAARMANKTIELCFYLLAIEAISLAQAVTIIGLEKFSSATKEYVLAVQTHSPILKADRPLFRDIELLSLVLQDMKLPIPIKNLLHI